jgi:serine-type anaerobic sulfatase-maturating enzyme
MASRTNQMNDKYPFHVMAKPKGAICNLECDYCFYLKKESLYPESDFRMDEKLLEVFIKDYISTQETPEITFSWQGGEPTLMGLDFFKTVVALQEKHNTNNQKIINAFQTNATLITEEWARFFKTNNFLLGISIDGPQELHDQFRRNKKSEGTFQKVKERLDIIKEHQVDYNVLTCVNSANAKFPLEVYRFFRDELEVEFIQFIPIVINLPSKSNATNVSRHTVSGKAYGNFLTQIFDEWVRNDVGKVFVQIFDSSLSSWMGNPASVCIFEKVCGRGVILEFNGDVYSCDHFVDNGHLLGNIKEESLSEMVNSDSQQSFGLDKWNGLTEKCKKCDVLFTCNGGCPKNRILNLKDETNRQNYLCEGYKRFFTHIQPYLKIMGEELQNKRPASNIMEILKASRPQKNIGKQIPGRNDPCFCGSGKKYKKCHAILSKK